MNVPTTTETPRFEWITVWQSGDAALAEPVIEFWRRENAISDDAQARSRLGEIVMYAHDPDAGVAAVCTAVPATLPRLGQPMYYYRAFVGHRWRSTRLVLNLFKRSLAVLETYARDHDFPCIGVLMEMENARFGESLRAPVWRRTGFVYIGKSKRGLDLRVKYFDGAQLHEPPGH